MVILYISFLLHRQTTRKGKQRSKQTYMQETNKITRRTEQKKHNGNGA
jgi:hypothetical protein